MDTYSTSFAMEALQEKLPLVSIIVITYNSAAFVTETLESISQQTYEGPMELIISDDCSDDNTVEICRKWTYAHATVFTRPEVTQTPRNSGICANYNHALKFATGEWVKYIAGDDMLTPECIQRFVSEAATNADDMLISGVWCFHDVVGPRFLMKELLDSPDPYTQARNLANAPSGIVEGPTFFIKTATLRAMNGWDMRYPMLEDFPFAFRYTFSGAHISVIKEPLVKYRVHSRSVSQSSDAFRRMFFQSLYEARMKVAWREKHYLRWWHNYIMSRVMVRGSQSAHVKLLKCTDIYGILHKVCSSARRK